LDRRADTSDGSGGTSPSVMTSQRDDGDDELTAAGEQPTEIIAAEGNDKGAAEATANGVPGLPADSVGRARDSATPASGTAGPSPASSGADGRKPASGSAAQETRVAGNGAAPPSSGTGRPSDASTPDAAPASVPADTGSAAEGTAAGSEPAAAGVTAAAFVWDSPETASASPSSPARNFLRSGVAKASGASRKAAAADSRASGQQASAGRQPPGPAKRSARQAHLTVARVEPWSVMKFSFVVSLVSFVILFVAVSILYGTLSALGVFASLQHMVQNLTSSTDSTGVNAGSWFTASKVLGYTALLGSLNIVLITAMSTIGAVIYNLTSRLIGGVEVTLRETE
jgi:hypothetical protein